MKYFLIFASLITLQSCYLDDVEQPQKAENTEEVTEVIEEVETPTSSIFHVTETRGKVIKGVREGDILTLDIAGKTLTPRFSDIYEKYLSCSWKQSHFIPIIEGYEIHRRVPLIMPNTKFGKCLVNVRDYLGNDEEIFNFEESLEELRLKVQGKEERFTLDDPIDLYGGKATFELLVTDEMITNDSELHFIVEAKMSHFVEIGCIEVLESDSIKQNIIITDPLGKKTIKSSADSQTFVINLSWDN